MYTNIDISSLLGFVMMTGMMIGMALSFTAESDNVKRHFYLVYLRETTTAMAAADYADLSGWNTFLALFNAIGKCENENVKIDEVPNVVVIDYGEEAVTGYNGTIEIKYLQNTVADWTDLDDLRGKNADLLLVDLINLQFWYVHNKRFLIDKNVISGEISYATIKAEIENAEASGAYGTIHTHGTIPVA